jgi:hydroxymethylglutaryl-CoA reductase
MPAGRIGHNRLDVEDRRKVVEEYTDMKLACVSSYTFDHLLAEENVENMFGILQMALGFIGPV